MQEANYCSQHIYCNGYTQDMKIPVCNNSSAMYHRWRLALMPPPPIDVHAT